MEIVTRQQLHELEAATAKMHGAPTVAEEFTVTPAVAQILNEKIKEDSSFLQKINTPMVKEQMGEAIHVDAVGMIAARTNTDTTDREPKAVHSLTKNTYVCSTTEYDTSITYALLDSWAKTPNLRKLIESQTVKQIVASRLMIAFNGTSIAKPTDPVANPLGQDVNEGWLFKIKNRNPANYLTESGATADVISIGAYGDYKTLDSLVHSLAELIDDPHKDAGDLVAIVGRSLLSHDKGKFYDANATTPTEKSRIEDKQVIGTYGGLPTITVPYFPAMGAMVTSLNNLSIYIQEGSVRRSMVNNNKRNRYESFFSMNEDFVVEDYGKAAALEAANVVFIDEDPAP